MGRSFSNPIFIIFYLLQDYRYILVGGIPTPLKNMSSSNGSIIPNIWKKMFQTINISIYIYVYIYISLTIPGDPTQELSTRSALCELNRAFGSCHSGDASGSGSRSKTSRTMPLKRSLCRSRAAWAGLAAPGWKRRRPRNPTGWGPRKRVRVNRCLKKVAEIDWVKVYGYGRYRYS